ncbi:MAG: ADP-ribosylglycohydrolase family protein [Salinivirgaceae bacterium]|nr:ADP-ribosylglycohydrolase family protein [Salinivirgaceae bacterium]
MKNPTIIGAIAGDVIGSVYEFDPIKTTKFDWLNPEAFFTDDSVLTIAIADALVNKKDFGKSLWDYGQKYPNAGFGGMFYDWLQTTNPEPYNSFGNGSAMRVSAAGFAADSLEEALFLAKQTALPSHNHPEGIKGAQATAVAIYLAKTGKSKVEIYEYISSMFNYELTFTIDAIRPTYEFNEICQETVPQAIVCFLESSDYESAIRLAISLGGDADTLACITGGIAAAFYKEMPDEIIRLMEALLPTEFWEIINAFDDKYRL